MSKVVKWSLSILVLILLSANGFAADVQPLDGIVAVVNDQVITETALQQRLTQVEKNIAQMGTQAPPVQQLKPQVLQQLINTDLQLQIAKRIMIRVSDYEVNQAIKTIAKQNHVSVKQLKQKVNAQGMAFDTFRKQIKEQITIQKLQEEQVSPSIKIKPSEVKQLAKQIKQHAEANKLFHLENILIPLQSVPTSQQVQQALSKANKVVTELNAGKDFKQLAIAFSGGQHALRGGDMGWRKLAGLPDIFAQRVVAMKVGEVSPPIRTGNGYHIIKLIGLRDGNSKRLTNKQALAEAKELLFKRKFEQQAQLWLQQMRSAAYIKIF